MSQGIRFICLVLFLAAGKLYAQNNVFRNYSVNNGLSSSEIYSSLQDSKGYVWFSGDAGVCRYNGYSFRTFTSEHGLADNTIFNMYEDPHGRIWFFGMSKKISYYNPLTDSVTSIACNDALSSAGRGNTIASLYIDEADTLYIGFNSGTQFYKIPAAGNYKKLIPVTFKTKGWHFRFFNNSHLLWGFTSSGQTQIPLIVTSYDSLNQTIRSNSYTTQISSPNDQLRRVIPVKDGMVFLEGGLVYYQKKDTLLNFTFAFPLISLYVDKQGNLWLGTKENGVYEYANGDFSMPPLHYFNNLSVSSVLEDTEGGYWFSTLEHGIYYTPSLVFMYYDKTSGLSDNKVYSVITHRDSVICFTQGGFMNSIGKKHISVVNPSIKGTYVYETDPKGDVLFISQDSSFFYNLKTRKKQIVSSTDFGTSLYTRKVFITPDKQIYALYSGGVCKIDPVTGTAKNVIEHFARTTCLYVQGESIWFGMPNGVFYYSHGHIDTLGNTFPLLKNRVDDIFADAHHNFWFATKGAGVIIKNGSHIIQLTVKNGLPSNLCKTLLPDSNGAMWVGTNRGISKITLLKDTVYSIENYSSADGLLCDEINQLAMGGNYIYAATSQGIIKFDKTKLNFHKTAPPVYISEFAVNEQVKKPEEHYILSHDENFIKISFIGLSYKLPGTVTYKYRLTGLDTVWKYTQNTSAQFTTLPPGEYLFSVYAINKDGTQSSKPAGVSFFIKTPYWKTGWFILLMISIICFTVYILFRTRVSFIKKTEEEKTKLNKKIAEVELKAIRAQMNPHFIFNAINSIQHYILANESEPAYRYLSKFSQLIRNVLENSKYEFISLKKEIETIELYIGIEKLRFEPKFDHTIYIDPTLDVMLLSISPLLIQPYVENAIWHGLMHKNTPGLLSIRFLDEDTLIRCVIEDNGVGRERAMHIQSGNFKKHRSMAISLNNELLEIIGNSFHNELHVMIYDIETDAGEPCGTRVEVVIPKIKHMNYDKNYNS